MIFDSLDVSIAPLADHLKHKAARNSAIAANIANIDTPGYKSIDVNFKAALGRAGVAIDKTHPGHIDPPGFSATLDTFETGGVPRRDGNDVNIDHEMVKLAQNQLEYRFLARSLARKFAKMREAITGRAQ